MQKTLEGEIHIRVTAGKNGNQVAIANSRPLGLAARLAGLAPEVALRRIALLFSVCRSAQTLAGCYAVENASATTVAPAQQQARSLLLAGETLLEHAMSLFLRWPALLGQPPAHIAAVRQLRASLGDLWRALYPQGDWMRPGGGLLRPNATALRERLATAREAIAEAHLDSLLATGDLDAWRATTSGPAAMLFRLLEEKGWNGYGASNIAPLEKPNRYWLDALLAFDEDRKFIAQPDWTGTPRFTGALARQYEEPLVQTARLRHGCGLAAHLLAHCVEIMHTLEQMQSLCTRLKKDDGTELVPRNDNGLALVQAARGTLVHRVEIADGRLQRYQILAPTEWNFHPRGIVACALQQENITDLLPAHLLVAALDPCVAWQIERSDPC